MGGDWQKTVQHIHCETMKIFAMFGISRFYSERDQVCPVYRETSNKRV